MMKVGAINGSANLTGHTRRILKIMQSILNEKGIDLIIGNNPKILDRYDCVIFATPNYDSNKSNTITILLVGPASKVPNDKGVKIHFKKQLGPFHLFQMINDNDINTVKKYCAELGEKIFKIGKTCIKSSKVEKNSQKKLDIDLVNEEAEKWYNFGVSSCMNEKWEEAIKAYRKAIDLNPHHFLAWNNLGGVFLHLMDFNAAIKAIKKAIKIDPKKLMAWFNLGNALMANNELKEAINSFIKVVEIDKGNVAAWGYISSLNIRTGDLKEALHSCKKCIALDKRNAESWCLLGYIYKKKGDLNGSIKAYKKAIIVEPDSGISWFNLGNCYKNQHDLKKAIEAYKKAIEIDPQDIGSWNNLGLTHQEKGDIIEAQEISQHIMYLKSLPKREIQIKDTYMKNGDKL
ncbi:MAG: tetratricopeptide repeat protein [Promethearchaeota archaeon]